MTYVVLKLLYSAWFMFCLLLLISMGSRLLFSRKTLKKRIKAFFKDILFLVYFPITIFSREGLKKLTIKIKEYL